MKTLQFHLNTAFNLQVNTFIKNSIYDCDFQMVAGIHHSQDHILSANFCKVAILQMQEGKSFYKLFYSQPFFKFI